MSYQYLYNSQNQPQIFTNSSQFFAIGKNASDPLDTIQQLNKTIHDRYRRVNILIYSSQEENEILSTDQLFFLQIVGLSPYYHRP